MKVAKFDNVDNEDYISKYTYSFDLISSKQFKTNILLVEEKSNKVNK